VAIKSRRIEYQDGDTTLEAHLAWDDSATEARPGVMVSHAWRGRSEFEIGKAERLAELGYAGFALDMYGKGVLGNSPDENAALMQPLLDNRETLQRRMQLALTQLRAQPEVDDKDTAAIGFCFGGLCVLDLARSGADMRGVASFHGLFGSPGNTTNNRIVCKVLAMHGWDDPMATPEQLIEFAGEMTGMGADWQIHAYGNTTHAFTNPDAADADHGLMYNAVADQRSWQALQNYLNELFGDDK
jgi:dienelactone hydrolase